MPVSKLLVEGKLDAEILGAILQGNPPVVRGGSKQSLPPATRTERHGGVPGVSYLRDRDFDYDPPDDTLQPVVDRMDAGTVLGWRWCRHEIENYLIDPEVVVVATQWERGAYEAALLKAAQRIRYYQIARWAVGTARRSLPPHFELYTKPDTLQDQDFGLPIDISESATVQWANEHVARYYARVGQALAPHAFSTSMTSRADCLTEALFASVTYVLLWCSGKDLLAALAPWLQTQNIPDAGAFRARMRDWIRGHPEDARRCLPEWDSLRQLVRA
jgi:hypothetical protein